MEFPCACIAHAGLPDAGRPDATAAAIAVTSAEGTHTAATAAAAHSGSWARADAIASTSDMQQL